MNCRRFRENLTAYVDRELSAVMMGEMHDHTAFCDRCADESASARRARMAVAGLSKSAGSGRAVPAHLAMQLKVLASREHQRAVVRRDWRSRLEAVRKTAWLWGENVMRPAMVPATGGVASAMLLFAFLTPLPALKSIAASNDVPLPTPVSQARLMFVPAVPYNGEITVDLLVDSNGRMMSYDIVSGSRALQNREIRRQFETALMLMEFNPATRYGQPIWTKVQIVFRPNATMEIKG